jgi:hypothetical protein
LRNDVTFLLDRNLNLWCMSIQFERPYSPEVEDNSSRPNLKKPKKVSATTNKNTTVEELLGARFSVPNQW